MHVRRVVDRPHVDLPVGGVRGGQRRGGDDPDAAEPLGHLEAVDPRSAARTAPVLRLATAARNAPTTAVPALVATGRDRRLRTARRRASENDATHTRSCAPVRSIARAVGPTASADFTSTFTRTSGHVPRTSSSAGTGSTPPIRARRTASHGRVRTRPVRSVTRSSVASCSATATPSTVAWTSVSTQRTPSSTAAANAAIEFSSPSGENPRWASAIGPGWSR